MSVYVKLFGRRPDRGLATGTGAGVRKAAADETARCSSRVSPHTPRYGDLPTGSDVLKARATPSRPRVGRPADKAGLFAVEARRGRSNNNDFGGIAIENAIIKRVAAWPLEIEHEQSAG